MFRFDVLANAAEADQVTPSKPRRRVIGLAPGQQQYRILIAEDRDSNRELLIKLLQPLGFEVRGVRNGAEGIAAWESWEPQLIWMDMRMPVMDGYEATRRIKATAKGQATVVIALTASAFESDRKLILSEGCDDFVRKPFVEEDIFEKLEKHLGVRFITEEEGEEADSPDAVAVEPEAFSALPGPWREQFRKATVEADYARLLDLIVQLHETHAPAARALKALVTGYEYARILETVPESRD